MTCVAYRITSYRARFANGCVTDVARFARCKPFSTHPIEMGSNFLNASVVNRLWRLQFYGDHKTVSSSFDVTLWSSKYV